MNHEDKTMATTATPRNRIVDHVSLRAGDLVPHPLNFRRHPKEQEEALAASYRDVGFTRSLLGYRMADGRVQLIDGHLRAGINPDMAVTVEIVDVTPEEAVKLLLTLDPMAALAKTDQEAHAALASSIGKADEGLKALWALTAKAAERATAAIDRAAGSKQTRQAAVGEIRYMIHVDCEGDHDQAEKLETLRAMGYPCHARFG